MKVVDHPYLEGVKCRSDGAVWIPASGSHKAHWTFGCETPDGYRVVRISHKRRFVHRLICEAFHGLCPADKRDVDHIDRCKSNNTPGNLRWCSRSENCRNKKVCDESLAKYGVSCVDDKKAYWRAYTRARYASDPKYREKRKTYQRTYRSKKKNSNNQPKKESQL